jgi:hypothetical protein
MKTLDQDDRYAEYDSARLLLLATQADGGSRLCETWWTIEDMYCFQIGMEDFEAEIVL